MAFEFYRINPVTMRPLYLVSPKLTISPDLLSVQVHIAPAIMWEAMDTLWLGILSLRDQGISGNVCAWAGVRSHIVGIFDLGV